ncbi:hypothetical protein [Streptomyces profundus]|uniref:hypothetical protein n=1 Tax=Streptomyces profundus TaxID=2867410 RepID=UPI001D16113C|nr:hypothetical protein [Streptomyces sp. MA3_2.13]UED84475.1 hypothetical protein K4G22_09875 [Streptomyces sp. MA3_2.13]
MATNSEPVILDSDIDACGVPPGTRRNVLFVDVDPKLVDLHTLPESDGVRMRAARAAVDAQLRALGLTVERCVIDCGAAAESVVRDALSRGDVDCVLICAGARVVPENLLLFERVINTVHRHAPRATICFNSCPADTVDAARRGLAAAAANR